MSGLVHEVLEHLVQVVLLRASPRTTHVHVIAGSKEKKSEFSFGIFFSSDLDLPSSALLPKLSIEEGSEGQFLISRFM